MLRQWNALILETQIGVGVLFYLAAFALGRTDGIGLGFFAAGVMAFVIALTAMARGNGAAVLVAGSSLCAVLAIFCVAWSKFYILTALVLACPLAAFCAAWVAKYPLIINRAELMAVDEPISGLFLDALPVVGAIRDVGFHKRPAV